MRGVNWTLAFWVVLGVQTGDASEDLVLDDSHLVTRNVPHGVGTTSQATAGTWSISFIILQDDGH